MNRKGVTLTELIITAAILSIGVLSLISAFSYLSKAIQIAKTKTIATNLAQEKIESLKNLSYYMLMVTTSPYTDTAYTPSLVYDTVSYSSSTVQTGGIYFTRAVRVDFAQEIGTSISTVSWTNYDTGLKQIAVYVMWKEGSTRKYIEIRNLLENPYGASLNAAFKGNVTKASGGAALQGATVKTLENSNWYGTSSASGDYSFSVSPGSYTLQCSSAGYFTQTTTGYFSLSEGQTVTKGFSMVARSSPTVSGYVYRLDHPVISQVVSSTGPSGGEEYVELFNPTTAPVNIGSTGSPVIYIDYFQGSNSSNSPDTTFSLTYVSTFVPSASYYLVASTPQVHAVSVSRSADAYYTSIGQDTIESDKGGGIRIRYSAGTLDAVGWAKNSGSAQYPLYATEGNPLKAEAGSNGLQANEQFVRLNRPGYADTSYGAAYDADNNATDFQDLQPMTIAPRNTTSTSTVVAGTPATGARVYLDDDLSATTTAFATTLTVGGTNYTVALFNVMNVATGTWTAIVSSGSYYAEIDTITVVTVSTNIPNTGTVPFWPGPGYHHVLLTSATSNGFVTGLVTNAAGGASLPSISVSVGGNTVNTNSAGRYFRMASTGTVTVVANPNNTNSLYTSESADVAVVSNQETTQDFALAPGGTLKGYVTSGSSPLPSVSVVATRSGTQMGQTATDSSGYFYIKNLSTGTYTVQVEVDPASTVSPTTKDATLTPAGTTVFVTTFTVTSGLGAIEGQVSYSGSPVQTGVLLIASTGTISTSLPPTLNGSTGRAANPAYYGVTSKADGTYSLAVRGSTTTAYNLYGWYTTFNGQTPTVTKKTYGSTITVNPGTVASGKNLSWP